jgi:hypothetical protein
MSIPRYRKGLTFFQHPVKISLRDSAATLAEQVGPGGAERNHRFEIN